MGLRIVVQREIPCEQVPCLKAFQWKPNERLLCLRAWGEAQGATALFGGFAGKPGGASHWEIAPALNADEREKLLFKEAIVYLSAN